VIAAPISTTQVMTASVMGVGATRRIRAVRWGVAREIGMGAHAARCCNDGRSRVSPVEVAFSRLVGWY
jgi:hypothetical protein